MIATAHTPSPSTDAHQPAVSNRPTRRPALDVRDSATDIIVTAEVPGVDAAGIEITIVEDQLTLRGRRDAGQPQGYQLRYQEYRDADFACSLALPDDIDTSTIAATVKDGVVRLVLPKRAAAQPRRIAVQHG
jgi:HSP20 family molecular chaperone IbpA